MLIRGTTVLLLLTLALGCTANVVSVEDDDARQWLRYADEGEFDFEGFGWLDRTEACEVFHSDSAAALSQLSDVPYQVLEGRSHHTFSSCECDEEAGEKAILLRGVYFGHGNGDLDVARLKNGVLVMYTGMGEARSLRRSAVVACLAEEPREVFVGIHSAL